MTIETTFGEQRSNYFVIREGGKAPSFKHASRLSAEREAERLAKNTPGGVFHIAKIKKTIKNTDSAPVKDPVAGDTIDQRKLAEQLESGDSIKVIETHYAHAGRAGVIREVYIPADPTEGPSIWVDVFGEVTPIRFSPSSLIVVSKPQPKAEAPKPEPKAEAPKAEERRPSPLLDLLFKVLDSMGEPTGPTEVTEEEYPGLALKPGQPCYIIAGRFMAFKGEFVRKDPDDRRMIWVKIEDRPEPVRANASRVYALDDSRVRVMPI